MKFRILLNMYYIKSPVLFIILWFVIPSFAALSILRALYYLHHLELIEISYSLRYHFQLINRDYPVLYFSFGVSLSTLVLSKLLITSTKHGARYVFSPLLGAFIYILGTSFHAIIIILSKISFEQFEIIRFLGDLLFVTIVSFTGFCFQDCSYGYVLPAIPFGLIWGGLLVYIIDQTNPNK